MISVSNDFKTRTKKIKQQNIKLGIVDGELTVKDIHFMTVKEFNALPVWMLRKRKEVIAKELKYSFEGKLFKTIMKQIEITVKNAGELKDKNVNFQYGIYVNNDFEYIDLGDFYIKDVEDDKGKKELVVTGYDKMINFMKTFKQSELQLTYPCTMLALVQKMCEICGVELYSTDFFNADLQVDEDYFTAQELSYRDVLEKVAESTETTIFIKDNKLYLHKLASSPVEKLDASYLTELTVKEKFGPVNALVLGRGDVEDNVEAKDDTSIAENGRCEIRFDENEFVEYQREQVIDEMFEQIKGLEYYAFEGSDVGVMWLEPCDLIELEDTEGSIYKSIYLIANITINTGISSDIEADIPEETNTEYKVTTKEEKKTLKVERLAKKNEGLIQDLVQETTANSEKLSKHEQTLDSITDTLSSVESTVEGTVKTVQVQYALSDSSTQAPEEGWSTVAPEWQEGKYMWQKTVTIFMNDMQIESEATCIQGANGKDGTEGKDGLGIEKLETQYYLSTSNTTVTGGSWKNTQDKWTANHYIWTRTKITWSDNSVTYSEPILAEGLNTANENANNANEGTKVVTTKMSQVEKTVDSITQTVTETTERLNNDYSTTEQTQSMIKSESDNITSSVTKSIDNIQVGGTNLIPNSAPYNLDNYLINNSSTIELTLQDEETAPFGKCLRLRTLKQLDSSSSWGIYILPTTKVLEGNKEYCFSLWMRATANTQMTVGYVRGGQTKFNVTTNWQKFTYKFIALTPTGDSHGFWISFPSGTILGRQIFVHSMKLEEGNKITAWSPAPSDDVKGYEFGTKIEQNWEHVKYAWNQISQAIQLEGDNGNATMAFLDNNKKFAEMGVNTVDNDRYISFAVPVNYGQDIQDGMAWGMQTPDGKFWPILYVKNFHMANQNAGDFSGELVLQACNLALEGINSAITCGNVNLTTADALGGIIFEDATTHKNIFTVMPETDAYGYAHLEILDKISFFRNQAGSETLRVGDASGETNCTITTDGYLGGEELYIGSRGISCVGNISAHSHIYCNNGVEPFSLAEKKRDIEKYNNKALDEVLKTDIYYYNYKEDAENIKRRVGAIIGDKYKCSKEIIGTEGKGIDLYSMISVAYKAIQEQQELIEKQNKTIENLISRVEKLEQKAGEA